jgi:two-component system osmolarity sensor histidine kinase EnvZ
MYYIFRQIKDKILPANLLARFMLIIIVPVLVAQMLAVYLFYQRHWYHVSEHNSTLLANEVAALILYINNHADSSEQEKREYKFLNFTYRIVPQDQMIKHKQHYPEEIKIFKNAVSSILGKKFYLAMEGTKTIYLYWPLEGEKILKIQLPYKTLLSSSTWIFVLWIFALTIVLLSVSIIFSRNQIKSIIELTNVVESYGLGQKIKNYKPSGATEIRQAGVAFIKMRSRIERQKTKRTQMLAMISHDLKTPLTRMKLQAELMPESDEKLGFKNDIQSMQNMIDSYLAFARGEGGEEFQVVELNLWTDAYIKRHYLNIGNIVFKPNISALHAAIKANALERAISNVIDNGIKYATNVLVSVCPNKKNEILISIEDNGKGIKKEHRALVFKPFYRGDKARSLGNSSGVGLGLAITKEIVNGHYGRIALSKSKALKGLAVKIILPKYKM